MRVLLLQQPRRALAIPVVGAQLGLELLRGGEHHRALDAVEGVEVLATKVVLHEQPAEIRPRAEENAALLDLLSSVPSIESLVGDRKRADAGRGHRDLAAAESRVVVPAARSVHGRLQVLADRLPDLRVALESVALQGAQRQHGVLRDRIVGTSGRSCVRRPNAAVAPHAVGVHAGDQPLVDRGERNAIALRVEFAKRQGEDGELIGFVSARGERRQGGFAPRTELQQRGLDRLLDRGVAPFVARGAQREHGQGGGAGLPVMARVRRPDRHAVVEQIGAQKAGGADHCGRDAPVGERPGRLVVLRSRGHPGSPHVGVGHELLSGEREQEAVRTVADVLVLAAEREGDRLVEQKVALVRPDVADVAVQAGGGDCLRPGQKLFRLHGQLPALECGVGEGGEVGRGEQTAEFRFGEDLRRENPEHLDGALAVLAQVLEQQRLVRVESVGERGREERAKVRIVESVVGLRDDHEPGRFRPLGERRCRPQRNERLGLAVLRHECGQCLPAALAFARQERHPDARGRSGRVVADRLDDRGCAQVVRPRNGAGDEEQQHPKPHPTSIGPPMQKGP
ncbi:MAG: hypothetical protein ACYS0E_05045, partial [Planctomycetota bacterium]